MNEHAHPNRLHAIRRRLLDWYHTHQRTLPWRQTRDPYAVWVSEIMLQQTRVETVVPYYQHWLRRFPDVATLAAAEETDVLKAWEGLGYYSRARNLHNAARQVVARFDGRLPADPAALRSLPGVGRYTAGAIASIAFGLEEPVLDGNVARVLSRLLAVEGDVKAKATTDRLWSAAHRLVAAGEAGLLNQALMDLGAAVCTPTGPRCLICPLSHLCRAAADGRQESLPQRSPAKRLPHYDELAAVIARRGRLLICRRPPAGLLGGLWELPGGRPHAGEAPPAALRRVLRERLALDADVRQPLASVRHAYTHFRITVHAYRCHAPAGRPRPAGWTAARWATRRDLADRPFGKAHRSLLTAAGWLDGR